MPFVNLQTNVSISKEKELSFVDLVSKGIEIIPGKKIEQLALKVEDNCRLYRAGTNEATAMVNLEFFNYVDKEGIKAYCKLISDFLMEELAIKPNRLFISVTECRHWAGGNGCNTAFDV